jgi:glycerophosphoryl diester phosphodiesterase
MYQVKRIPQVIAHRGFSGAFPENTRSAILGAIAVGADMVEIDVRMTRDGVPVVFHDAALGGHAQPLRWIEELTSDEVRRIDLGAHKGERFRGERILTLDEALALVQDRIPVNLDMKSPHALAPAIRQVQARCMTDQTVFSGCSGAHVCRVRALEPQLHVLMNVDDYLRTLLRLCSTRLALFLSWLQAYRVQAAGLNIGHHLAADSFIRGATARNLPVWTWTVDNPARARRLVSLGAVSITSNWPDRILAAFPNR